MSRMVNKHLYTEIILTWDHFDICLRKDTNYTLPILLSETLACQFIRFSIQVKYWVTISTYAMKKKHSAVKIKVMFNFM